VSWLVVVGGVWVCVRGACLGWLAPRGWVVGQGCGELFLGWCDYLAEDVSGVTQYWQALE
jgi:hypothetical protein